MHIPCQSSPMFSDVCQRQIIIIRNIEISDIIHALFSSVLSAFSFTALYSTLFTNDAEAAFCNYRLWESFGFIGAFAWSFHLCFSDKLYIVMSFFYIGSVLLLVVIGRTSCIRKHQINGEDVSGNVDIDTISCENSKL